MFRASSCPSSGATSAVAASGLPSERGGSSVVCGNTSQYMCGMCEANVPAEYEITRRYTCLQLVNHKI